MPEPKTDPGHLLPPDIWQQVVADAEHRAEPKRAMMATGSLITKTIPAYSYGGPMPKPTLIVIHDAETPLQAGYAVSLATNWFGTSRAGTSAHYIIDPVDVVKMLDENTVAWHVGPNGNGFTIGIEQSGYVSLSRAQWTTAAGMTQMGKVGALTAEIAARHGIPLRWATDDEIRAAARGTAGGVCRHDDIRRVLGGTTHTDPAPNYPSDLLAQAWTSPLEDDMTPQQAAQLTAVNNAVADIQVKIGNPKTGVLDRVVAVESALTDLATAVAKIQAGGATIDYAALAKAVNDDAAARMAS
ncbi:MAG TPA: peptidoglycan recognition family protein [Mycobacteriales bacterium]|nr:peptidoglycan recognition family protein [Mycobacteriales bacterium]